MSLTRRHDQPLNLRRRMLQQRGRQTALNSRSGYREEFDERYSSNLPAPKVKDELLVKPTFSGRRTKSMSSLKPVKMDEYLLEGLKNIDRGKAASSSTIKERLFDLTSVGLQHSASALKRNSGSQSAFKLRTGVPESNSLQTSINLASAKTRPTTIQSTTETRNFIFKRKGKRPDSWAESRPQSQISNIIIDYFK